MLCTFKTFHISISFYNEVFWCSSDHGLDLIIFFFTAFLVSLLYGKNHLVFLSIPVPSDFCILGYCILRNYCTWSFVAKLKKEKKSATQHVQQGWTHNTVQIMSLGVHMPYDTLTHRYYVLRWSNALYTDTLPPQHTHNLSVIKAKHEWIQIQVNNNDMNTI